MILSGLLWIDLALVGAILAILLRYLRLAPVLWGFLYLLQVELFLAHWLVYSLEGELLIPLQMTLTTSVLIMPWTFWIFALYLFVDDFRPGRFHALVFLAKITLALAIHPEADHNLLSPELTSGDLLRLFPNVLFSFALIFHVMLIAWKGKESDLIELRIDLRRIFLFLMGLLIVWYMLSILVLLPLGFGGRVQVINATLLGSLALSFLVVGLQLRVRFFPELEDREVVPLHVPEDRDLEAAIVRAFETDRVYREEGCTIRRLAEHIGSQEYRVRRVINRQMGFRNFNEFLNRYRIQDACELLGEAGLPIIRIATEVGYPSPAPFNRAFRQMTGMTPTEFRQGKKS